MRLEVAPPLSFGEIGLIRVALAAGASFIVASTAYDNGVKVAFAAFVIVFAGIYSASYSVFNFVHKLPPILFCERRVKLFISY